MIVGRLQGGDADMCPLCGSTLKPNPKDGMRSKLLDRLPDFTGEAETLFNRTNREVSGDI